MIQYAQIVFMQGEEANDALSILDTHGELACIKYLSDWDYGDTGLEFRDKSSAGESDQTFQHGEYLLTYNTAVGYIGLERVVGTPENFQQLGSMLTWQRVTEI